MSEHVLTLVRLLRGHRSALLGIVSLLASGMLSAVLFSLMTSQRFPSLSSEIVVFTVLFIQWQTLGLTITKLGIEQVVFAATSADPSVTFKSGPFFIRTVLPLSAAYSVVLLVLFSPQAAMLLSMAILLDVGSLIRQAELNGRQHYQITSIANLLNFPLFFALFFTLVFLYRDTETTVLLSFTATSAVRFSWLFVVSRSRRGHRAIDFHEHVQMGLQQVLNYVMFKADQLLVAVSLYVGLTVLSSESASQLVFLAKFPELVSGVAVVVGTVLFPRMPFRVPESGEAISISAYRRDALILGSLIVPLSIAFLGYRLLWAGGTWQWTLGIPFLLHASIIFTANNVTYTMIRNGLLSALLRNLAVSLAVGTVAFSILSQRAPDLAIAWMVPIQLSTFVACVLLLPNRPKRTGWARANEAST